MKRTSSFVDKKPILYLVSVPIGNLKEMNQRAIEIINECDTVFCEDTRNTYHLLSQFKINKKLFSLREHNELSATEKVLAILNEGKNVCYVSDAGYPAISDPGKLLAIKVRENDFPVSTINGSSAFLCALCASSHDSSHFYFHGFLDSNNTKRNEQLKELKKKKETLIFYEAPHRIKKMIDSLYEILGNRKATIARELTKINEEFIEGCLSELVDLDFTTIKGEIVVIVDGNKDEDNVSDEELISRYKELLKMNISLKSISEIISFEYKINKNYIYKLLLDKAK